MGSGTWIYKNRLKCLQLHSLARRRVRGDQIEVYKCVKGFNKGDIIKVQEIGKNWFTNRVVDEWN